MVLRILTEVIEISSTGLSPSLAGFPKTIRLSQLFVTSSWILTSTRKSYNTPATARQCCNIDRGLGCSAFAHRYSQNQFLSLFLRVIRCFNSPGIASSCEDNQGLPDWVFPFGNQRIDACLQLPVAYRSKPRPSSPLSALASAVRPYILDHIILNWNRFQFDSNLFSLPPASVQVDFFVLLEIFFKKNSHIKINNNLYLYRLPIVSFISTFHESSWNGFYSVST